MIEQKNRRFIASLEAEWNKIRENLIRSSITIAKVSKVRKEKRTSKEATGRKYIESNGRLTNDDVLNVICTRAYMFTRVRQE